MFSLFNNCFVLHLYCDNIIAPKQATTSTGIGALGSAATVFATATNHYKEQYSTQGSASQDHTLYQLKRYKKLVTKIWSFSTRKLRLENISLPLLELIQNPRKSVRKYWLCLLGNDVLLLQQTKEIQYRKQQITAASNNKPVMMNSCFS